MSKPVLLAVDDDRDVLSAIERDLRRHYGDQYRIVTASSGAEALEALQQLRRRSGSVALLLVDQRMPKMAGIPFLCEARKLYPDAARVLLTAYADTAAAIAAINEVGLHHYLMKPWDPPEERLYPVLDDLLSAWSDRVRPPFEGIRVVGSRWSPQSYAAREFLARNQVPYQWVDIEQDAAVREQVASLAGEPPKLPVILFPDGSSLVAPENAELAEKAGLQTLATRPFYDVVIVGGGPAGLANALYAASEGLHALLIEQHAPGGQAGTSSFIENYLGFPGGVTGADLARRAAAQARRFGAEIMVGRAVAGFRREDPYRIVTLADGHEVSCHALVLATGMAVRELDVPGIAPHVGTSVYYGAAMSEAALYRGQDVATLGGANSAGQGALFFSRHARSVTMLVRAPALSPPMSRYLADRIETMRNIQVIPGVELIEAQGNGRLERLVLRETGSGATRTVEAAALFVFIGVAPRTEQCRSFVELDAKGFILTGPDLPRLGRAWPLERDPLMFETSVPGVFAAGDVRSGANRRVAAAVGEGSAAIYSVQRYLQTV
ncbi:MAG TPA: FAD-dependent oxidoreductase [Candidatus Eisenbacteria bacterium]